MASSSSSSSSSSRRPMKHQVFLSFRGEDTRHNFTSHLLKALEDKGISVFFDEKKLERGEQLSRALSNAIAASNISIIVLSQDYASSKSCLAELSHIMHRKHTEKHIVLPVFYHVDPSLVRHLGGTFKTSFEKHESEGLKHVDQWNKAFAEVGKLKGWHIDGAKFYRPETEYIKEIVDDVTEKLRNSMPRPNDCDELVGLDDQKNLILGLLEQEESRVIGLWGPGGIGKTTLADAVFHETSSKFDDGYFLQNVRAKTEQQGKESLRNELLSKLLNENDIRIHTPSIGPLYRERLNSKRVFVVFDDVSHSDQIHFMGVEHFGRGSKIILTSRDRRVLYNGGAEEIHKVNKLNMDDSLQLFSTFAFKQLNLDSNFRELSNKFVEYARGNPLALKVLGSQLYKKSKEDWESELRKLKEYGQPEVFQILKTSFDGLGKPEKDIFLDIACFFKGEFKEEIENFLSCVYEGAVCGINNLLDKCLLDITPFGQISMHDMLEEMGKEIVRQESKHPENRSRLWNLKDVSQVLKYNEVNKSIEGIKLQTRRIEDLLSLLSPGFEYMLNLRYIHFYIGHLSENEKLLAGRIDSISLPNELRYLCWENYPFKSLSPSFNLKNLVVLKLHLGHMEQLWNDDHQDLVNLRVIDLRNCKKLKKIPSLSGVINLQRLHCCKCESLVELPCLNRLASLQSLVLSGCKNLRKIPNLSGAINLKRLNFEGCFSLVELPCLDHLTSLESLILSDCNNLRKIPNLSGATNLKWLNFDRCFSLVELPCLNHLAALESLVLSHCTNLKNVPNLSGAISLKRLDFKFCFSLVEFSCLSHLTSLERLDFSYCHNLKKIIDLSGAINLKWLNLKRCIRLVELPCLNHLASLENLILSDCRSLRYVPNLPGAINLRRLNLDHCFNLIELPCLSHLTSLERLVISDCEYLRKITDLSGAVNLRWLKIERCFMLLELPCLNHLVSLESLVLSHCKNLRKIPDISGAIKLKWLNFECCFSLVELPCLNHLVSLERLVLFGCKNLRKIPNISGAINLKWLNFEGCFNLGELPCLNHLKWLEKFNLRGFTKLKKFPELSNVISELNLSSTEIEEVPDLIQHHVELRVLRLSHSKVKNVSSKISKLESLRELDISSCEGLKILLELPRYLWCLDASHCTSLEKVSFTDHNFNSFHDSGDAPQEENFSMSFLNCFYLNQDSIQNIRENAMLQIHSLAQRCVRRKGISEQEHKKNFCGSRLFCCLPGNKIPAHEFEYRSVSSLLTLKIAPTGCSRSRFLAFAICLVVDLWYGYEDVRFFCRYQLTAAGGEKLTRECCIFYFKKWNPRSKHVLILFSEDLIRIDNDYKEASFELYTTTRFPYRHNKEVEKFGVELFYVDAESLAISGVVACGKSNSNQNYDSQEDANIEEGHDGCASEVRPGEKRRFGNAGEQGDGGPKRLKYFHLF